MNHCFKSQFLRRITTLIAAVAIIGLSNNVWAAVTLKAKVTDSETSGVAWTILPTPPAPGLVALTNTSSAKEYQLTGNPTPSTPLNLSITASGPTSYGYAGSSYNVGGKALAPSVVLKPGYTVSKTTAKPDPVGPLTMQVHSVSGPSSQMVNMRFGLPAPNSPDVNHTIDDTIGRSQLGVGQFPSQSIVFDLGGLTDAQINGAFNATYNLYAHVTQSGVIDTDLFNGSITFGVGQNPTVGFTGTFANGAYDFVIANSGNAKTVTITNVDDIGFQLQADKDFDLTIESTMSIGDEFGPNFTAGNAANFVRPAGVMGLFDARIKPLDPANFSLSVVPEPASFVLAGIAAIGLAGYRLRCRR